MATVKHVADLADVNISTVSRYLSGKLTVTPETEQRILNAIKETNYRPNIIAQSLRRGSSNTIAVVAPDIYQPGISEIIFGVDNQIRETDYLLMTIMTQNSFERELAILRILGHMMVGGVVIIGQPSDGINSIEKIRDAIGETPMMFISRNFRESEVPEICPDQVSGVNQMTTYLLERGYQNIGLIVGIAEHPDAIQKIKGYELGLASQGFEANHDLIVEGYYRPEETQEVTKYLLTKNVDAIICASDLMAISAIKYIQDQGLSIPDDVAVTGYGGTTWANIITPKLTTVSVEVDMLGRKAVRNLIEFIDGKLVEPKLIKQAVSLIIGDSA